MGKQHVYRHSGNIVARNIDGQLILVPLTADITAEYDDALYTFNPTGAAIWQLLDGETSTEAVIQSLAEEYSADIGVIEADVLGLLEELERRGFIEQVR